MNEQELLSLRDDLQDQAEPQKWGHQIQQAPECIILMARCKLLVSRPSLMTLEVQDQDLQITSLRASVESCTHMGQDTLRSTAEQMGEVSRLARNMSQPGGIIAKILDEIDMGQSSMRHKRLQSLISEGIGNVNKAVTLITEVKQNFEKWDEVTRSLSKSLGAKTEDENKKKKKGIEKEIEWSQSWRNRLQGIKQALTEDRESFAQAWEEATETYNQLEPIHPLAVTILCAATALFKSPSILFSSVAPWRAEGIRRRIEELDRKVAQLRNEIGSAVGVMDLLHETLDDLSKLQAHVKRFMDFLIKIQSVMSDIKDSHDRVLIGDLTTENVDELDQNRKRKDAFTKDAMDMQCRFLLAYKAASLYNAVSQEFIITGVSWLTELCFVNTSEDGFKKAELDIEAKRSEICDGAKLLIAQRIDDNGIELMLPGPAQSGKEKKAHVEDVTDNDDAA